MACRSLNRRERKTLRNASGDPLKTIQGNFSDIFLYTAMSYAVIYRKKKMRVFEGVVVLVVGLIWPTCMTIVGLGIQKLN